MFLQFFTRSHVVVRLKRAVDLPEVNIDQKIPGRLSKTIISIDSLSFVGVS